MVRLPTDGAPPSTDDLEALANAVREAARPAPSGARRTGRPGGRGRPTWASAGAPFGSAPARPLTLLVWGQQTRHKGRSWSGRPRQDLQGVRRSWRRAGRVRRGDAEAVGAAFVEVTGAGPPWWHTTCAPRRDRWPTAFIRGATSRGADVVHAGLGSTDLLYYASGSLGLPGVMFTASHNPARYNGMKMCRAGAVPIGSDTGLDRDPRPGRRDAEVGRPRRRRRRRGTVSERDLLRGLRRPPAHAGGPVRHPAAARWWSTRATAWAVTPSRWCSSGLPDRADRRSTSSSTATSPTTRPTRWSRTTCATCRRPCSTSGADIGLAFDGDADRCWVIDERGESVSPSAITALVAARELAKHPGATIIHNLITSRGVPEIVAEHGGEPVRTRVGPLVHQGRDGQRPARSSAASTPRTTTSGTSGSPTPACWPRCTCWPRWASRTGRCRRSLADYARYAPRARSTARSPTRWERCAGP